MISVRSGNALTIPVALESDGMVLSATSVSYGLVDGSNMEIITQTALSTFTTGDLSVSIFIDPIYNTVAATSNESRLLKIVAHTSTGAVFIDIPYIVLSDLKIGLMNQSYQSYQDAELVAFGLNNINAWVGATQQQKINALTRAFEKMGSLTYLVTRRSIPSPTSIDPFQDQLYLHRNSFRIYDLNILSADYVSKLPPTFLSKLMVAQVYEANHLLDNDPMELQRINGLIEKTVGESTDKYSGRKLKLPLCREALDELTGYVELGGRIGRA